MLEGYEGYMENLEGGFTAAFERYSEDADLAPPMKGLVDDQCQSPHWGYVLAGKVTFRSSSGEETFEAGDLYYVPPGHTPTLCAGTEVVEFSPTAELMVTLNGVLKNVEAKG